jgi:PASTA domain-containing protein
MPSFLPHPLVTRLAILVLVALGATAGLTYAAGSQLASPPAAQAVSTAPPAPVVVPDVRNQAFVFAKGALEEAGFAWRVSGSVQGYAANVVVSQSPAAGTRVVPTGAPLVTLILKRNGSYPESGEAEDASPYAATAVEPTDLAGNPIGPAAPARKTAGAPAPASEPTATPATATPAARTPKASPTATWPQHRPVAFAVPGGAKEPLDEMPLPDRATALGAWLDAHPAKTAAAAQHWLYQNEWIVTGAKLGWWRGAEALKTLIAVDRRAQSRWGIGAKSAGVAEQALAEVQARSKP